MPPFLSLQSLTKRFGPVTALEGVSLDIPRGDLLAVLGPSGSGKTTALRLLAGFETPDQGRILLDRSDVTALPPAARRFGMVFQHYALFPHLDVGENVGFGLESQRVPQAERVRRVRAALELVELEGLERRRVGALSGGQQQRVALARALAPEPRVLLLDEPLSNLDPALRERTRRELRALIRRIGITTILVTHEQEEAFDLADHVALLHQGRLEQVGTPETLYQTPATPFTAGFIGRSSVLRVELLAIDTARARVRVAGTTAVWEVDGSAAGPLGGSGVGARHSALGSRSLGASEPDAGEGWVLYVRPEAVRFITPTDADLTGQVTERRYLGGTALFTVSLHAERRAASAEPPGAEPPSGPAAEPSFLEVLAEPEIARVGDRVGIAPKAGEGLHLFRAESPA
ncbi:MAG: ABC transporter ATP-binding protein [Gemmatimonadales bacterium]